MATYVLVHGAMGGGWQLREVARRLRGAGHEVYTPTLTGLGERSHLLTPEVDLHTHVQDIVGVIEYEDLRDVILMGKSYSGIVITGVAERVAERIRHLVYLDALVPWEGESFVEMTGPEIAPRIEADVRARGDGWRLPADRAADWRLTDHPWKAMTQRIELGSAAASTLPRTYILCTERPEGTIHARVTAHNAERAKAEGWRVRTLATSHDAERTMPDAVAGLLLPLA